MPNVYIEAFAHGKPVIASNIGSLPEVVENNKNGLIFTAKDSTDLADKINYLISNEDLITAFGKNAREKIEREYNSKLHYERLSNILIQI